VNAEYFSKIVRPGDCLRFRYDFDLLLRALLKIVFNAGRSRGWQTAHFEKVVEYIRGKAPRPDSVRLFLQLLVPSTRTRNDLAGASKVEEIGPLPIQVYARTVNGLSGIEAEFSISVWSYHFYLVFANPMAPEHLRKAEIERWIREPNKRGASELTPDGERVIYSSSVDILQIAEDSPVFRNQVSKARSYLSRKKR
jgi:hypothetical protein